MSHIMKIYKTLLYNLNVKRIPHQESFSAIGVIPAHVKTLTERNCQVIEKEEEDLHEQEEDIFDDDHNTITVSG